jgi:AGCS family alanine or glycine:cation symporter
LEEVEHFLSTVSNYVWGYPAVFLLLGTHIFLTFRLHFIQRFICTALKLSISRPEKEHGDISHFASLMTALAATVGTGNIIGVATAVLLGGPGAVFWMWLTGIFGLQQNIQKPFCQSDTEHGMKKGNLSADPCMF